MKKSTEQLVQDLLTLPSDYDKKRAVVAELEKYIQVLRDFVPQLAEGLLIPDRSTRIYCASLLRQLKEAAAPAVPKLLSRVVDPNEDQSVREQAAKAMGMAGKESLEILNQLADDPDEKTRHLAFEGLASGDFTGYIDTFIAHLADPSIDIRYSMNVKIASNGNYFAAQATLEKLIQSYPFLPMLARPYAASAILQMDPSCKFPLSTLLELMSEPDQASDVLKQCLDAIGYCKEWPPDFINAVAKLIDHNDRQIRIRAVLSLSSSRNFGIPLRPGSAEALPEMILRLRCKDEEEEIREQICYVITKLEQSAAPAVYTLAAIIEEDPVVIELQKAAALALASIGPSVKEVKKILEEAIKYKILYSSDAIKLVKSALKQIK